MHVTLTHCVAVTPFVFVCLCVCVCLCASLGGVLVLSPNLLIYVNQDAHYAMATNTHAGSDEDTPFVYGERALTHPHTHSLTHSLTRSVTQSNSLTHVLTAGSLTHSSLTQPTHTRRKHRRPSTFDFDATHSTAISHQSQHIERPVP